jgi:hypothetical protein
VRKAFPEALCAPLRHDTPVCWFVPTEALVRPVASETCYLAEMAVLAYARRPETRLARTLGDGCRPSSSMPGPPVEPAVPYVLAYA